jgi:3,4-dihydroxy 2-butanone 4-phosphate synthase / GTP cyclohydrolase II
VPADADPIDRVRAALSDIAVGRPVVVVDDENRGDLVVASELATPQLMSFMVRHTSGFVCVAVTNDDADRLDLPLLIRTDPESSSTAQCVAVDAGAGVSTGISAADRARTIQLLAAPSTSATDLVRPGHVVPLRVPADGVVSRRGGAEAAVDLAVLAGLRPSGALCTLVSTARPGDLARGPELHEFAREHGLSLVAISDLVSYRLRFDTLVERGVEAAIPLDAGRFTAVEYHSRVDGREHLALVHGEIGDGDDVMVYVHQECLIGDALGSAHCECGTRLQSALARVADEGRGVVVYVRDGGETSCLRREVATPRHQAAGDQLLVGVDDGLGHHVVGAQILRELGVRSTRLLSADHLDRRCARRTA